MVHACLQSNHCVWIYSMQIRPLHVWRIIIVVTQKSVECQANVTTIRVRVMKDLLLFSASFSRLSRPKAKIGKDISLLLANIGLKQSKEHI